MLMVLSSAAVRTSKVYRNKFFQPSNSLGSYMAVRGANAVCDAQQNVALKAAGLLNTAGYKVELSGTYAASSDHNVSSEAANAPGTNGANSALAADCYTTLTDGAEVLDWLSYASMATYGAGNDLSADAGATDIKGATIGGWYPGADYVAAPAVASTSRRGFGFNFGMGF